MAWTTVHWKSELLGKSTTAEVLLPERGEPPFPTLYLLHGLSDDASMWLRGTRIEFYVRDLPLVVVMPDGYRGFYTNHDQGPAFARHIGEEVPAFIERHFQVRTGRRSRAIGGFSMGGYGALRVGLEYAEKYASIHSHSGAVGWSGTGRKGGLRAVGRERNWPEAFVREMVRIFGASPEGTDHDLVRWAQRARQARRLPKLRLDCGTEDYLIEDNRGFHAALRASKIPHEYQEGPGAHTWDYWDENIQAALAFHAQHLGLQ